MKKNNLKKISVVVASLIMVSSVSFAVDTIAWGATPTFRAYASDGITLLPGSALSSVGGFVQLLYLGTDGLYNGFINSGTGVAGDDSVVQTTWVGTSAMNAAGQFFSNYSASTALGSGYQIRFFDTASPNYAGGALPATGYYGLSQKFTQTGDPDVGGSDTFNFNQNYSANIAVVPEPSTVALMLAGLGVLGFARMRRK